MPDFNERLLQFIWQHKLLKPKQFFTTLGNELIILKQGDLNTDAGPDFFNGQIQLNGLILAGNIELHLKTSDWLRHGHQKDKSYDNIILHVVYENDLVLDQNSKNNVEVLELKDLIKEETIRTYNHLIGSKEILPCSSQLEDVADIRFTGWVERMTIERMEVKMKRIEHLFEFFKGDYAQTFYTLLLRNFGFKVNGPSFEVIARHLPLQLLLKHSENLLQIEALLFGICGFLDDQFKDKHIRDLQNEFAHLRHKYTLTPLEKKVFKFSRLRPANFPSVRLAQFAALVHTQPTLFSSPQSFTDPEVLKTILKVKLSGYWKNHYMIDGKFSEKDLSMGDVSGENIVVNTFAPFFFFYAKKLSKPFLSDLALKLLSGASFEKNAKTELFETKKELLKNAGDSQGIINLYDNYCIRKQCLRCGIAGSLFHQR